MRTLFAAVASLALALIATPSQAQLIVVGNALGNACWRAAEFGAMDLNIGYEDCTRALELPGMSFYNRAATYVNRAVIRMRAGDSGGALADATRASEMMPRLGEAHVNRGAALLNLMRPEEALTAIDTGLTEGSEKLHLVYYNRASAKYLLGDIPGAYYDFQRSVEIRPDFALAAKALTHFRVTPRPAAEGTTETVDEIVALSSPVNLYQ